MSATNRRGHKARSDGNYATPPWAVRAILPYLPMGKRIIDPCAGSGNILRVLSEHYGERDAPEMLMGIEVNAGRALKLTTVSRVTNVEVGNGLKVDWNSPDLIVMNPPFALAEVFTRRALNFAGELGTVAVLLRIGFSAGIAREHFWTGKVADMNVLAKRPGFEKIRKSSTDSSEYAWFIFGPQSRGIWRRLEDLEPKVVRDRRITTKYEKEPTIISLS